MTSTAPAPSPDDQPRPLAHTVARIRGSIDLAALDMLDRLRDGDRGPRA